MATDVKYNQVILHNVTTREWSQKAAYDQSATDLVSTKYRMQFEGIFIIPWGEGDRPGEDDVNAGAGEQANWTSYITFSGGEQIGEGGVVDFKNNATDQYTSLRTRLMQPRKALVITVESGSNTILNVPAADMEVGTGPHPQDLQIIHITGNRVFRIIYTIECEVTACDRVESGGPTGANQVLNNRWSVHEQMDQNFFTTRRIKGRIRFSSANFQWQAMRGLAFPPLETGFRRKSYQYEVLANGLEADYTIVDAQTTTAAPWPATTINGTYTESTADGIQFFSEVRITLEAPPHVSRTLLIARGAQVIENRLQLEVKGDDLPQNIRLDGATITEHLGDTNAITMAMRVYRIGELPGRFFSALKTGTIGRRLTLPRFTGHGYNSQTSPVPPLWGHKLKFSHGRRRPQDFLYMLHCHLQDPCVNRHSIYAERDASPAPPYNPKPPKDKYEPSMAANEVDQLPKGGDDSYSAITRKALFVTSRMSSKYFLVGCRTQMPIAAMQANADPHATTCVVTTLGRTQARREIRVESERVGEWPLIPLPLDTYEDGSLSAVLLKHWVTPQAAVPDKDGARKLFRVVAYYLYAMNRPPTIEEKLRVGVLPFTSYTQEQNAFDSTKAYSEVAGP